MKVTLSNGDIVRVSKENKQHRGLVFHLIEIFIWLWAATLLFVLGWGVLVSFTDGIYYSADPSKIIPRIWRFKNYVDAFSALKIDESNFFDMTWNSIWFSTSFAAIRVFVTAISAYVVARYNFKLKKVLYGFIILQMMVPIYGQTLSNYKLFERLGLIDTPLQMIGWGAGHGMFFLILHSFFVSLPSGYEDAGRIDGASEFVICFKLLLPMSSSIIVAMFIATWTGQWNNAGDPLLYLPSYPTLASGLFRYRTVAAYTLDFPIYFAGVIIGAIPPTVIFIIFSDTIMKNLTVGGLKG